MPQTDLQTANALAAAAAAALQAGDLPLAVSRFEAARRLAPADRAVLRSLGALYRHGNDWPKAWSVAETGLRITADQDAGFRDDRLAAMAGAGFTDAAGSLAAAWATMEPDNPQARYRFGDLLLKTGRHAAALAELQAALARQPDRPDILVAAAEAAFRTGDHARSRAWLDRAVALDPDNRSVRMARATIMLSLSIWDPGLADYEHRLRPDALLQVTRSLSLPRWQGEDLTGKTLLVVAEQGVGDQIRLARDLATLRGLCGHLIVECAPRLVPLFTRSLPGLTIAASVERRDGRVHHFDYGWLVQHPPADAYIELGSVMLRLWQRGLPPDRPIP
ncbi:tetratricopeptide repeat protein [Ferrovibrio xuzhouensis]|uniref:Tetratricopeptide repeat protein n=1 Tax=Ferrovibrio xuzhouensis TaxID=1576914 RepID=A0ABV7VMI8_9PROT